MNSKKLVLLLVIGVVVALFVSFGGHEILTLENLQKHQSAIEQWINQNLLAAVLGFAGVYVVVTALSLPGAAIMTLAGGAFSVMSMVWLQYPLHRPSVPHLRSWWPGF